MKQIKIIIALLLLALTTTNAQSIITRDSLKTNFQTGKKPTQANFYNFLQSYLHKTDDISSYSIVVRQSNTDPLKALNVPVNSIVGRDTSGNIKAFSYVRTLKVLGITPWTYRAAWSSSTAYDTGDVVSYNGSCFVSLEAGTNHTPSGATPPVNNSYWGIVAIKGSSGVDASAPSGGVLLYPTGAAPAGYVIITISGDGSPTGYEWIQKL